MGTTKENSGHDRILAIDKIGAQHGHAQGSGVERVMHTAASKRSCTIFSSKAAIAGEERG